MLEGSGNGRGMIDSPYGSLKVLGGRTLTIQNVSGLKSGTDLIWFNSEHWDACVEWKAGHSVFSCSLLSRCDIRLNSVFEASFSRRPDWTFVLFSSDVNCCLFHGLGSFIPMARWRGQLGCGDIGDQQSWKGVPNATFFEALPWRWSSVKREYVHNMYMYVAYIGYRLRTHVYIYIYVFRWTYSKEV